MMNGCVATIGFFDGVHRGHQFVIGCVVDEARRRGSEALVVTFDRSPREVVSAETTEFLTTRKDTARLVLAAGADRCEVLRFDSELAALSAADFMRLVLKERLNVGVLVLGYDNRFGRRDNCREEGFEDYVRYGKELGIEVIRLPELASCGSCSSSAIRSALREGDVATATMLLGRPYCISGLVVHGRGEGCRLGFPTANLSPDSVETLLPACGVYAVDVSAEGVAERPLRGMMNIGTRPTFNDGSALSLEVHLFDFDGNLYDRRLTVSFMRRIRAERSFDSPESLQRQLILDKNHVLNYEKI
jgi:riboflavin kinase/FMN adenylyltransferase